MTNPLSTPIRLWPLAIALAVAISPGMCRANVDRSEYLPVAGARLFMIIKGDSAQNPLLIWLHGGPGGAERPLFELYNAPLERHFLVVYLDQRGAGKSFDPKADPKKLTIARHVEDLDAVVDHLRSVFHKDKVILVGHSWGSALGLIYASRHPGKVAGFVGVGQVSSTRGSQQLQYDFVMSRAKEQGDARALKDIARIGPPPFSARQELAIEHLVQRYGGDWRNRPNFLLVLLKGMLHGYVWPWQLPRIFHANNVSLEAMNGELLKLDMAKRVPAVNVPVVFMLGRLDRQVDSRLAAQYFEKLSAPAKKLVWFDTAHNIPFEAPNAFNTAVPRALKAVGALR